MTESSPKRYWNLMRNIRNWAAYFTQKNAAPFLPTRYITRGNPLSFDVPSLGLYLVFKEIFMTDFYSVNRWISELPKNPIIVDVGANAGYFNMLLLSKRPDAVIYAYEAIEANYQLFKRNIDLNPSIKENIALHHCAVTGAPMDHILLYKEADSDNSVTASVYQDFEKLNMNSVTVPANSLANILQEEKLDHVDFLKLDCEGSEYPIIYDSPASIWQGIQSLFIEVHPMDEKTRNIHCLVKFLEEKGYATSTEVAGNGCFALFAIRK